MDVREVATYKGLDGWLSSIMETLKTPGLKVLEYRHESVFRLGPRRI
jgi:hypothetical protein